MKTTEILSALGVPAARADFWGPHIATACNEFHITTPLAFAAFLAQVAHESNLFAAIEENLNYTKVESIVAIFRRDYDTNRDKKIDESEKEFARQFVRQPERLANYVYANQNGNGPEATGDGWRFRGRGLIQLTGKANYRDAGKALNVDLVANPDLLATPPLAARSAGWYWHSRSLSEIADKGEFDIVTKRINGGLNGQEHRLELYEKAQAAIKA